MKKILCLGLVLGCVAGIFMGCAGKDLPGDLEKDTIIEECHKIIEMVNDRDFQGVVDLFRDDLKEQLTADALGQALNQPLDQLGDFVKYKTESVAAAKEDNTDKDMAAAVIGVEYSEGSVSYVISFDTDMKVIGLYLK